jgi:hypothetical protein
MPDRIGWRPVAIGSLVIEAAGQGILWSSGKPDGGCNRRRVDGRGAIPSFFQR